MDDKYIKILCIFELNIKSEMSEDSKTAGDAPAALNLVQNDNGSITLLP